MPQNCGVFFPVGLILPYIGTSAPRVGGWLIADGRIIDKTANPELQELVKLLLETSPAFKVSGYPNQARLPDLRGMFLRGQDLKDKNGKSSGNNPDGETDIGTVQQDTIQGHWHQHEYKFKMMAAPGNGVSVPHPIYPTMTSDADSIKEPVSNGSHGIPRTASETRPKNVTVLYVIKY